jgi:hypothetical protein
VNLIDRVSWPFHDQDCLPPVFERTQARGDYKNFDGDSGVKPEEALPVRESKV